MKSEHVTRLQALAADLDSLIKNPNAEVAVVPGNGPNESMLIGSPDSLLRLAKVLIEVVGLAGDRASWSGNDLDEETVEGVTVIGTNRLKEAFYEFSPIWPMCAYLTPDDDRAKELVHKLSESAGSGVRD